MNNAYDEAGPGEGPRRALRSAAAGRVYGNHSGYRNLKAYQVAELLYDFTCRFCTRVVSQMKGLSFEPVELAQS